MMTCARLAAWVLISLFLFPRIAEGQVSVQRGGDENPAISVTKSIFWGGLGGLILGGAIALVADKNEDEIMKWSFVGGTFAGLGLGVWHVTHHPEPRAALLEIGPGGARVAVPSFAFEATADPLLLEAGTDRCLRAPLFSVRM